MLQVVPNIVDSKKKDHEGCVTDKADHEVRQSGGKFAPGSSFLGIGC
jgi:hypothetical protein